MKEYFIKVKLSKDGKTGEETSRRVSDLEKTLGEAIREEGAQITGFDGRVIKAVSLSPYDLKGKDGKEYKCFTFKATEYVRSLQESKELDSKCPAVESQLKQILEKVSKDTGEKAYALHVKESPTKE